MSDSTTSTPVTSPAISPSCLVARGMAERSPNTALHAPEHELVSQENTVPTRRKLILSAIRSVLLMLVEMLEAMLDFYREFQQLESSRKRRRVEVRPRLARIEWQDIISRFSQRVLLMRYYRLSEEMFNLVLDGIKPMLQQQGRHPSMQQYAVSPDIMLAVTLRWLAGGS
eukprot:598278-Hanusia_phi.AAC.9